MSYGRAKSLAQRSLAQHTYSAQFNIQPLLTFTRISDATVLQLDTGDAIVPTPLTFNVNGDFVDTVDTDQVPILIDPGMGVSYLLN